MIVYMRCNHRYQIFYLILIVCRVFVISKLAINFIETKMAQTEDKIYGEVLGEKWTSQSVQLTQFSQQSVYKTANSNRIRFIFIIFIILAIITCIALIISFSNQSLNQFVYASHDKQQFEDLYEDFENNQQPLTNKRILSVWTRNCCPTRQTCGIFFEDCCQIDTRGCNWYLFCYDKADDKNCNRVKSIVKKMDGYWAI